MKDLKENIQKNNIKKLVLSVVLGMFCYCINNAMEKENDENETINNILIEMLQRQTEINKAKEEIKDYGKKIYAQINEDGKVTKGKVIEFIRNQYTLIEEEKKKKENKEEEGPQEEKDIEGDIKILEQYFHLENKEDKYECTEDNFTEIFWEVVDIKKENIEGINEIELEKIIGYFQTIIEAEKITSKDFQGYYDLKKKSKSQYEEILKEIMKDCYCKEEEVGIQNKFLKNLASLYTKAKIKNEIEKITTAIKNRIKPGKDEITEGDFIYFLKQKIGIEEKKEEGGCPCCYDCCNKNEIKGGDKVVEGGGNDEKKEENEGGEGEEGGEGAQ